MSVDLNQIVVSYKFKHNDESFKYFIGYLKGEIVKPFCIILPEMSGYIKYFENVSKNMSFLLTMMKCRINMRKFVMYLKIN